MLKTAVAKEPILKKWCPELPTKVETDVFNGIINNVLSQWQSQGEWYLMVYYIKTISPNKVNYGIKSKELLIVINTLNKWRAELIYLPEFEVITN